VSVRPCVYPLVSFAGCYDIYWKRMNHKRFYIESARLYLEPGHGHFLVTSAHPGAIKQTIKQITTANRSSLNIGRKFSLQSHDLQYDNMNQLTLWSWALLGSHQLCSHSIVSQHFREPEGSIPRSQEFSACPYPEPIQSTTSNLYIFHFPNLPIPSLRSFIQRIRPSPKLTDTFRSKLIFTVRG
jgi:hypothetical protein